MPAKDPEKRRATVRAWYHRTKHLHDKAKRTRHRQRRQAELASWYAELKSKLACILCGENHPACIVFHHSDPSTKEVALANALLRGFSRARMLREIEKCDVLCANCHAKHHARERANR